MVVLLDSGTTTLAVARALRAKQNLTICTNSLPIAQLLCRVPGTRVHMLGGEIDATDEAAVGVDVIEALARFRVDIAFVGAGGLSEDGGVTDYTRTGAEIRARMLKAAARAYFVIDSEKFGRLTPIRIPGADAAALIADAAPPRAIADEIASRGLELIIAAKLS
jgi:DeoR family glycerol-3-phosphate regulon repressor